MLYVFKRYVSSSKWWRKNLNWNRKKNEKTWKIFILKCHSSGAKDANESSRLKRSKSKRIESVWCFLSISFHQFIYISIRYNYERCKRYLFSHFVFIWYSLVFLISILIINIDKWIGNWKKKVLVFLRFHSSSTQIYRKKHEHTFFPIFSSTISSIHFFSLSCGIITTANISSNASNELHNAFSSINFAIRKLPKYTQMKYRSFSKVFETDSVRINAKNALDRF